MPNDESEDEITQASGMNDGSIERGPSCPSLRVMLDDFVWLTAELHPNSWFRSRP